MRYPIRFFITWVVATRLCAAAGERPATPPPVGEPFTDRFERAELGDQWQIAGGVYSLRDGHLTVGEKEGNHHPAIVKIWKNFRDIVLRFSFRFDGSRAFNVVFNDMNEKSVHSGHVTRLAISPRSVTLTDDKTGLMSLQWINKRADPKYQKEIEAVRARTSRRFPADFQPGRWYSLVMEVIGDEMRVSVDGRFVGSFRSPGFGHPTKMSFHFSVSGRDLSLDDVSAAIPGK